MYPAVITCSKSTRESDQCQQYRHQSDASDVILMSLILFLATLISHTVLLFSLLTLNIKILAVLKPNTKGLNLRLKL